MFSGKIAIFLEYQPAPRRFNFLVGRRAGDGPDRYTFSRYSMRGAVFMRASRYILAKPPAYQNTSADVLLNEAGGGRMGGIIAYKHACESDSTTSH